jgi:hypothetical protein
VTTEPTLIELRDFDYCNRIEGPCHETRAYDSRVIGDQRREIRKQAQRIKELRRALAWVWSMDKQD